MYRRCFLGGDRNRDNDQLPSPDCCEDHDLLMKETGSQGKKTAP